MAHVIVLDSLNEDIYVCGACKTVFNSLPIFLDHKNYKCTVNVLDQNLINSTLVETTAVIAGTFSENPLHVQQSLELPDATEKVNNETWLAEDHSCVSCKKRFKKLKSLQTHMKVHSEKPFQCPVCGRSFIQNSHLQRHIDTHKVWPNGLTQTTAKYIEADLLSYSCTYCNNVFPDYSQYRGHLKNHLILKKFKCIQGDCMNYYDSVPCLLKHVSETHQTVIYSCHLCSCTFDSLENIAKHQYTHNKTDKEELAKKLKLHKCTQCDAEFRKPEKLSLHMLTENHKKVCIHCDKTFASDKRLRLHLQIHKKLKPFQCNICNSTFQMKKYLSTHMLKHGSRQFKCTVCKYMFKRSDLLQRHMRLHQAKKLFKCPFRDSLKCLKEFSRSDKLKSHIKSHTKHVSMNSTKSKAFIENSTTDVCIGPQNEIK